MKRTVPLLLFFVSTAHAQPAAQPPPSPDKEHAEEEAKANKFRPAAKLGVGYEYAHLWGVPINAGRLRMGVGGQNDDIGHYVMASILVGETDNGRRAWDVRVGYANDFRIVSLLRVGFELELGYLVLHRATTDSRQWALGAGAAGHIAFDAIQFGERSDHALFIEGRFEGHVHFGGGVLWGPTISLGMRF